MHTGNLRHEPNMPYEKIMNGKGNIALALGPMNGPTPRSVDDAVIPQAIRFKPTAMLGRSCVLSRAEQRK